MAYKRTVIALKKHKKCKWPRNFYRELYEEMTCVFKS